MITTRLEIGSEDVAIVTDIPVNLTFQASDVREPDKRNASFSKTITLYGTNEINKIFENIFETNIALGSFNPNKKIEAKYYVNDILNFKGNLQLLKITLTPDNNIVYECNIIGEVGNVFVAIGDAELTDLDFSAYDHTYNRTNQIDSWANYNAGSGYYYPFVNNGNNGGSDSVFNVKDFIPCLFVREYIEKILSAKGYTFTSDFFDTDEFKSLIVYPNIDKIELTSTQLNNRQFYVGLGSDLSVTPNTTYVLNLTNESTPYFDSGNQVSGTYAVIANTGKYNVAASNKIRVDFTHTDTNVSYVKIYGLFQRSQIRYSPDGVNFYLLNQLEQYVAGATLGASMITVNNGSSSSIYTKEVATGEITLNAGWYIESRFLLNESFAFDIKYYNSSDVEITPTGTSTITYKLVSGTNKTSFYMLAAQKEVSEGNALEIASVIPRKIKQKDFFKSIIQAFNLQLDIDKDNPNNLIIEPYNDYYNVGFEDWERKLDLDKEITINPLFLLDGKKYLYSYKEDKDYYNTKYKDKYNEIFGQNIITIDNDFLKQEKKNELIFSPTPMVANYDLGIAYPKIQTVNGFTVSRFTPNIRLMYAGGVKNTSTAYTYKQSGTTDLVTTEYGYAGHIDDTDSPTLDLNFDYPKEVFYNYINSQWTSNNLYNRFHANMLTNLVSQDSKTMTCYVWLTARDIEKFTFRKKYFINDAYWIVNKIYDYTPMVEQSTKVELIKLLTVETHTPSTFKLRESTTINTGSEEMLVNSSTSLNAGTNIVNKGTNCIAVGENIYIPPTASNVTVIGNNIEVLDNVSNVSVINQNDLIIDESYNGTTLSGGFSPNDGIKFIYTKSDLPTAVSGVITLLDEVTYFICGEIDLTGDSLVCGQNTTIIGGSSENCRLKSTGLTDALITSNYSLPLRNITIEAEIGVKLSGDGTTTALDWFGVNFTDCEYAGDISDYSNVILTDCAFLNSGELKFDGTIGTVGINTTLFDARSSSTCLKLSDTLTITRRFRIIYSSFVVGSGETGIQIDPATTIPTEGYILDTVNFAGGGTYLTGLDHTSNDSLFINCKGITNTAVNGQLYMQGNATATTVSATNTFYKVAGTTTASADNSKFTHSNNRLTCDAVISRKYLIQCTLSFTAGNGNVCEFGFYDSQSSPPAVRTPSKTKATANASGRAENVTFACVLFMDSGDYLEIHTSNTSAVNNITVDNLNFVITEIK